MRSLLPQCLLAADGHCSKIIFVVRGLCLFSKVRQCTAVQILEVLNTAANEGAAPRSRRERADPSRRHTLVTCACAAALAGLHALAQKYRGELALPSAFGTAYIVHYSLACL